jgi:hypothetical protein
VNLIEINDHRLCLRNAQGVLAASPGFANIVGKEPVFGDAARQIARLHPRQSFNQFWQQLSLDPLLIKTKHFRHHADLAYSQLQQLSTALQDQAGVLVAAPTTYNRNHLSVLLGVLKQSQLPVVGLVDHALLQAVSTGSTDCVVLDLQLHQAVLIAFRAVDGVLVKEKLVQVPGAGLLALQDAWSSAIVNEFLQQSRFDPTHSAETEQYIANQLETWLNASRTQGELLIEINHKHSVHQARLTHEHFVQRSKSLFARIARELPELRTTASSLHVPSAHLMLPGLTAAFPGISGIADEAAISSALHYQAALSRPAAALSFITRLPLDASQPATAALATLRQPTHLLLGHQAVPLPQGKLVIGTAPAQLDYVRVLPLAGLEGALVLHRTLRGVSVEAHGPRQLRCNGQLIAANHSLELGDVLQVDNHPAALQLIVVE